MIKFLYWFTIFLLAYFLLYVTGGYYLSSISWWWYILPLLKESVWFIFVSYCVRQGRDQLRSYIVKIQRETLLLLSIAIRWISATWLQHDWSVSTWINIAIWLKYGLYSSIIFYTAARVGYSSPLTQSDIINYIKRLCHIMVRCCAAGIAWQWMKRLYPDVFYTSLGYGPIGDYHPNQPHPIYYRTGPWWWPRLSWLMSGPNNLWYLLVAYASLVPLYVHQWRARILYYTTTIMTLSRAALLWSGIQWLIYGFKYLGSRGRWLIWWLAIVGIIVVWILSVIKGKSTTEHFTRTWWAVQSVVDHPRGIWLWSSWPWVHRNGSVLPENFYLQLLIDYGTIPFIGRCAYWYLIIRRTRVMLKQQSDVIAQPLRAYIAWFLWLLIVWLFLHVFEDSVVNYLFFIPFWLLWWYGLRKFAK
jgi:hypothetical protein